MRTNVSAFTELNIEQDEFDQIIADEGARGEIYECLMFCFINIPEMRELSSELLQYVADYGNNEDGGPGSGNFGHAGVPGQVGGSAPGPNTDEIKSIRLFTGSPDVIKPEDAERIESAIKKTGPLDAEYEYSRGMGLSASDIDKLLKDGYYEPGRLTSWSPDESTAADFAYDIAELGDKIPVVLQYRGTKQLDKGIEVGKWSQHPEEDEAIFSGSIKMKVAVNEVSGYSDGEATGTVYINLYDPDELNADGGPGSGNFGHEGRPGEIGGSAPGEAQTPSKTAKAVSEIRKKAKAEGKDGFDTAFEIERKCLEEADIGDSVYELYGGDVIEYRKATRYQWEKVERFSDGRDDRVTPVDSFDVARAIAGDGYAETKADADRMLKKMRTENLEGSVKPDQKDIDSLNDVCEQNSKAQFRTGDGWSVLKEAAEKTSAQIASTLDGLRDGSVLYYNCESNNGPGWFTYAIRKENDGWYYVNPNTGEREEKVGTAKEIADRLTEAERHLGFSTDYESAQENKKALDKRIKDLNSTPIDTSDIKASKECHEKQSGKITYNSGDFGKPGRYVMYRQGNLGNGSMMFFAPRKEGADMYASGRLLGDEGPTGRYEVEIKNPLIIKGDGDVECVNKAYAALHPDSPKRIMTPEQWKKADASNASALNKSDYDAIIYLINGAPAEIQVTKKRIKEIEKTGSFTTTAWSRVGLTFEDAKRKGYYEEDPHDYERVDGRFDSDDEDEFDPDELYYFLKGWQLKDEEHEDGGPGSGNFGHAGRPGELGGSAPGNGSRTAVNGSDITKSYSGKTDLKSILKAQGFDGLPKVVSKKDFDDAVKVSSFIAQRTYSASSQEILDAYRDQLYNGDFYVEGGEARYGQGMYCASSESGEVTDEMRQVMEHYKTAGETKSIDTMAMWEKSQAKKAELQENNPEEYEAASKMPYTKFARKYLGVNPVSYTETMTLDPSAKTISIEELQSMKLPLRDQARLDYPCATALAALLGYDAVRIESRNFTVILNRTKTIFLDENDRKDGKDDNVIHFQTGKDGVIYAIRGGKVIGWVMAGGDAQKENTDGGPGSGNFGHKGRPGEVGGSLAQGAFTHDGEVINNHVSGFKNPHVSEEERDTFKKDFEKARDFNRFQNGYYTPKTYTKTGQYIRDEIIRRQKLRKSDDESPPDGKKPEVEDIYDTLRDIRSFGPPEGFDHVKIATSEISQERTEAILKEALDRYPSDWYDSIDKDVKVFIHDSHGRAVFMDGYPSSTIHIYAKENPQNVKDLGVNSDLSDRRIANELIHELGHYMEASNSEVRLMAQTVLEKRTKKSEEITLPDGFASKPDSFFDSYVGKQYYDGATEITSMMMQRLGFANPFDTLKGKLPWSDKEDPESLKYILGVLGGL